MLRFLTFVVIILIFMLYFLPFFLFCGLVFVIFEYVVWICRCCWICSLSIWVCSFGISLFPAQYQHNRFFPVPVSWVVFFAGGSLFFLAPCVVFGEGMRPSFLRLGEGVLLEDVTPGKEGWR